MGSGGGPERKKARVNFRGTGLRFALQYSYKPSKEGES